MQVFSIIKIYMIYISVLVKISNDYFYDKRVLSTKLLLLPIVLAAKIKCERQMQLCDAWNSPFVPSKHKGGKAGKRRNGSVCAPTLFLSYLLEHKLIRKKATDIWKVPLKSVCTESRKQGQSAHCFVIHL